MKVKKQIGLIVPFLMLISCSNLISNESNLNKKTISQSSETFKIKFKAGVIRNNGDIVPASITKFEILPFSLLKLKSDLEKSNNVTAYPKITDQKYRTCKETVSPSSVGCLPNFKLYKEDENIWVQAAYKNFKETVKTTLGKTEPKTITTNLAGEADLSLPSGTWYISGVYENSLSKVIWDSKKIEVSKDLNSFELSNINGLVINKNDFQELPIIYKNDLYFTN